MLMQNPVALLDAIIKALTTEKGETLVSPWFSDSEALAIKDGQLFIAVHNDLLRDTLRTHFSSDIAALCRDFTGRDIIPIFLSTEEAEEWRLREAGGVYAGYTFERFIVGNSNKFAHAAAVNVANNPAAQYNPLFIYGQSGLGKTHLLYAIASHIHKARPGFNIIYKKGEEFTNELIEALRVRSTAEFRAHYRQADLLLVDDIQFIAGKESTQEEFFHTFNALYEAGKQVVLTSDRPPKEIALLAERLRTRFEAGLLADVQPPDLETRMALVREKSAILGLPLSTQVVTYIAETITNNVRELEGAVKKIFAKHDLMDQAVDIAMAQEAIADLYKSRPGLNPTADLILEEVSSYYGVSIEKLKGSARTADVVFPRQVAGYLMRSMMGLSLPEVGKVLNQHHTTILHGITRVQNEAKQKEEIAATLRDLRSNITAR